VKEDPGNVAAYIALDRLVNLYARGVDRNDTALVKSVYHDDAIDDHGTYFSGSAMEFAERLPAIMAGFKAFSHCITNRLFEIDGDEAVGEIYLLSFSILNERPDELLQIGGRYLDRYEKRQGEWKIAHRKLVWDWTSVSPTGRGASAVETLGEVGTAGRCDPSYDLFKQIAGPRAA
jgi:hypothetical protein